jgi:hypothetical protein
VNHSQRPMALDPSGTIIENTGRLAGQLQAVARTPGSYAHAPASGGAPIRWITGTVTAQNQPRCVCTAYQP